MQRNLRFAKNQIEEISKHPCEIDLLAFPRFISYVRCDWHLPYNRCSDVMNTTSHRVYQTGEGERGSEDAANDLGRLRIKLDFLQPLCNAFRGYFVVDIQQGNGPQFFKRRVSLFFLGNKEITPLLCEIDISPRWLKKNRNKIPQ